MIKHSQQQTGSVHLVIVIILIVTVLLGTLGFTFWQNFINSQTATIDTAQDTSKDQKTSIIPSGWVAYEDTENKLSYYLPEGENVTIESFAVGEKIHVGYGAPVFLEYDGEVWQTFDIDDNNEPNIIRAESLVTPLALQVEGLYKAATYMTGDGFTSEKRLLVVDTRYIWLVHYQFSFSNKGTPEGFIEDFVKTIKFDDV